MWSWNCISMCAYILGVLRDWMDMVFAMCGHGGERWVAGAPVDGFHPAYKTVFQYHSCRHNRGTVERGKTRDELYHGTVVRTRKLREAGFTVIEAWACVAGCSGQEKLKTFTKQYPHAIFFDFEAFGNKNWRKEPTENLTLENARMPIFVSVGDTFEKVGGKPTVTHICERDPKELCRKFVEELERRGAQIRSQVCKDFIPKTSI